MNLPFLPSLCPRKGSSTRNECGFSLLEVIIALLIFAIGVLGVAAMQSRAVIKKSFANNISQAMREVNQSEAERLLSLGLGNAQLTAGTYGPTTTADGIYSTVYLVQDDLPVVGSKQITITTSWNVKGKVHSASLIFTKDNTL